jgi:hypothetical protein
MQHTRTTPVPNVLFDQYIKKLKGTELKILLVIIRQTLGWADNKAVHGRKEMDWISGTQLQAKTGSSRHSISSAIEVLVAHKLIQVFDAQRKLLLQASERKGKPRLFFSLAHPFQKPVDNGGDTSVYPGITEPANAIIAQDLRKKITALAQKMRYTKETLQN